PPKAVLCSDYNDAVNKMSQSNVSKLLALTGVQTINKLRDFWQHTPTVFRILDRQESLDKVSQQGFPQNQIVFYNNDNTAELISQTCADAIITKQSGDSGGFQEKMDTAIRTGVKIFVIKRPDLPKDFVTVTGNNGLRKMVEKLCPGFFKLRSGFTTGACATAAATAAMQALLTGDYQSPIAFSLPDGEIMKMPVQSVTIDCDSATATVIKDAGDDPDVTNGHEICVNVKLSDTSDIRFFGGQGIGTVTLPGTGLEIGQPAINPVPRQMIVNELRKLYHGGVDVTISVPKGEELALKTFNSRIGILGGISIIGTTGVVMPFSHEAFIDAIRKQIEVAQAIKAERIVINSGARSEKIVKSAYPSLPPQAFIHYGNAIGETIKMCAEKHVTNLTIGIMIGKAVKLAEGHLDTHSHNVTLNRNFLCRLAYKCGCSQQAISIISTLNMARELWTVLTKEDKDKLLSEITQLCHTHCAALIPECKVEALLISDSGQIAYSFKHL
ncbi:MAG: cobalt-precorrin-5B (C(1))-methyltransferase CbiD, partial [Paramuribaculum sp.]|nr:cobalt-precorrin-5B (C(1))-methyltransferase CbiD [Paramuribaculum sp.]